MGIASLEYLKVLFSDEFEIKSHQFLKDPYKFRLEEYGLKAILTSFGELESPTVKAICP